MCSTTECTIDSHYPGRGKRRGLNFPPPIPRFLPFPPFFFCWLSPLCVFSIAKYCAMLYVSLFLPFPPPWESRFLPRLLPPPVNLPPPFLPGSRPPAPPPHLKHAIGVREPKPVQDNESLRCSIVNKRATSIQGNELHLEAAGV